MVMSEPSANPGSRLSPIDTGDTVFHEPTGETWLVALVRDGRLSWCGYPEGTADLADCSLLSKAPDEDRERLLRELAAIDGSDHRARYAQARLEQHDQATPQ